MSDTSEATPLSSASHKPQIIVVRDPAELAERASAFVAEKAREAVRARGTFHLAVAGGTTPRTMYERLSTRDDVAWRSVQVWFGDERAVPPDHDDSNYRMVKESLLERTPIPSANVHRMEAEAADLESSAAAYAGALPDHLDLILLGMGEDGHTASLFPGAAAIQEKLKRVVSVAGPKPPPKRLTVTPLVIAQARSKLVMVAGATKADMLARVLVGPGNPLALPVQLARDGVWIIDEAAAAKLPSEARK
jgi:6-phosphogluconolactonase